MNYDQQVKKTVKAYQARNQFYFIVSPIVGEIYEEGGKSALRAFSEDVGRVLGTDDVSYKTLEVYAWMYNKTKDLNLPKGLSLNEIQEIASMNDELRKAFVKRNYEK